MKYSALKHLAAIFVLAFLLSFTCFAWGEDLLLTGTITPQQQGGGTLAVTITPTTVDLSSVPGEIVERTVTFANTGTVTASVRLASPTDVTFTGLTPVFPNSYNADDPNQKNNATLFFIWDPAGWPINMADFYFEDVGGVRARHASADFSGEMFQLAPGGSRDTKIRFQSNHYLDTAVNVSGSITFTITAAS